MTTPDTAAAVDFLQRMIPGGPWCVIQGRPGVSKGGQGHPGADKTGLVPPQVQKELEELRTKYEIAKVDVQVKDKLIEESEKRRREDATLYQESILLFAERLESTSKKLGRAEGELVRLEGKTTAG